jgi:hypothetical protein
VRIEFQEDEIRLLRIWAANAVSGGHWGDGNMLLGEESIVLNKINQTENKIFDFNSLEQRVLMYWLESNQRNIHDITGSDMSKRLAEKIKVSED